MKVVVSYVMIFALIILFALFLDATSGFFVLIIFAGAIILSAVMHVYAVKAFDADIFVNRVLIEKGEEISLTVRVSKAAFFLPTVFEIKLTPSYHFECAEDLYAVTLNRSEQERVFKLKSAFWGKGGIGIEWIKCGDILGIFSGFGRFNRIIGKNYREVKIFPAAPDLSERSELVRTLEESSAYDDNEQTREIPSAVTGFPGYEHRDYVPGDSLKSVNWKLSAKRDKLLVRKPEAFAGGDQVFVLDDSLSGLKEALSARAAEQRALEAMLALIRVLTKREIVCRVYVRLNGGWVFFEIDGEDGIETLRFALTEYSFGGSGGRIPDISSEKASGFVIFTANADGVLGAVAEGLRQKGIAPEIASPSIGLANWIIDEADGEIIFSRA
ncbi:MAG: DUF58 domain-containing protein [Oscillospiraceae bacterium]|jgi:uncharacterized protein (DUF58 family)|nr:DUF58 domain-containing protein [Oscillospiraceae bacterium]